MNTLKNIKNSLGEPIITPLYKLASLLRRGYWYIVRPTTKGARVMIMREGKILLVKHSYDSHWYLPGGGIKKNEDPVKAACREIQEELGIDLDLLSKKMELFGIYENEYEFKKDIIYVYNLISEDISTEVTAIDAGEIKSIEYFDPLKLPTDISPGTRRRVNELLKQDKSANAVRKW